MLCKEIEREFARALLHKDIKETKNAEMLMIIESQLRTIHIG